MDKNEAFVITYEYGEYEDRCEVVYGVVFDQARAEEIVETETRICAEYRAKYKIVQDKLMAWMRDNPHHVAKLEGERFLAPVKPGEHLSRDEQLLRADIKTHNQQLRNLYYTEWKKRYDVVEAQLKDEYFTAREKELYMISDALTWNWYVVPVL